jgi:hypothetical protein
VNIHSVEELILENRQIAVCDITFSVGSVEKIICEHLFFKKVCLWWVTVFKNVCAQWVPKMLTFDQKAQLVTVTAEHLNRFELKGNTFLQ